MGSQVRGPGPCGPARGPDASYLTFLAATMASPSYIPVVDTVKLTSIFTPPSWCSSSFYTYHPLSTQVPGPSYFLRAQAKSDKMGFDERYSACYPPDFGHFNDLFTETPKSKGIYSPGVCPSGWASNVIPGSTSAGVTSYICCPLYV